MSTIRNREVKVIGFWYFRPLVNLLIDDVPNIDDSWLPLSSMVVMPDKRLAQKRFHRGCQVGRVGTFVTCEEFPEHQHCQDVLLSAYPFCDPPSFAFTLLFLAVPATITSR